MKRGRNVYVICSANARHKQRQGFATVASAAPAVPVESISPAVMNVAPLRAVTMQSLASSSSPAVGGGILTSMGLPRWATIPEADDDEGL